MEPMSEVTVVVKPHTAIQENALTINAGDIVHVLEKDETGWWGGHKEGEEETGWFPGTCVRSAELNFPELCSTNLKNQRAQVVTPCTTLSLDFDQASKALEVDDIVFVFEQTDFGWCKATVEGDDRVTWIPRVYVCPIDRQVLTVQPLQREQDGSVQVSCINLAGDSVCTLKVCSTTALRPFWETLARKLDVSVDRLQLVSPSAKVLAPTDADTFVLALLADSMPEPSVEEQAELHQCFRRRLLEPRVESVLDAGVQTELVEAKVLRYPAVNDFGIAIKTAVVVKPHLASDDSQLDLRVGDRVTVLEEDPTGWWGGCKADETRTGWFPGQCLSTDFR